MVLRIESLEIADHILEKVESKHRVSFAEVEEACLSDWRHVRRDRAGLYKPFSQTDAGRYLLVVLVELGGGSWRIAAAREMQDSERRLYLRARGGG